MPSMLNKLLADDDNKQAVWLRFVQEETIPGDDNITIHTDDTKTNEDRRKSSKHRFGKYLFPFILLSLIIQIVVIFFCLWNHIGIRAMKRNSIEFLEMMQRNHTQTVQLMQIFRHELARIEGKSDSHRLISMNSVTQETEGVTSKAEISVKNKWRQNATTVAGRFGRGNRLNQLAGPHGIFVDTDKTMYIADTWNDRIIQWKYGETKGEIIAGGSGAGNRMNQLRHPTDVIIDKRNNALIIADEWNRRVVRWSIQNKTKQEVLIADIACQGLAMDKDGSIYVCDYRRNEVRRWKEGEKEGYIVAGSPMPGDDLNQLNYPTSIFVDDDYSIYVSDNNNHRVIKWVKDAKEGIIVAGGHGQGNTSKQLAFPQGVIVDRWGHIYVADSDNHRVMCWSEGKEEGEIIVGENEQTSDADQLAWPIDLSFDSEGNLYVTDLSNHRVQKFQQFID